MSSRSLTRRDLLKSSLAFAGAGLVLDHSQRAHGFVAANDRPRVGAIGTGSRWCQQATGGDGPPGWPPTWHLLTGPVRGRRRGLTPTRGLQQ